MNYDLEEYLLAIETMLKSELNNAITALNTEKNDSIVLKTVANEAYFLQTLNDTVANYNPHILLGLDDIVSQGIGPGTVKTLSFSIVIILEDRGEDLFIGRRMLRYGRVLEELCNSRFNKIFPHAKFKVTSLVPIAIVSVNTNDPYRAIGVQIETNVG